MSLSLLAAPRPLLADGAMATNLFDMGLTPGEPAECWNALHPERVRALHRAFLRAGADILLTNSFGGHPHRLGRAGLGDRAVDLNRRAARIARAAADAAGRPVLVAGAIGPTGEREAPPGTEAGFALQMQAFAGAGVDLLWVETMSYADEIMMAGRAAAATGLPYVLTASFDADGRTLGGLDPADFAAVAASLPVAPVLLGVNCGGGAGALGRALTALRTAAPRQALAIKASAGVPEWRDGRFVHPMTPDDMAAYAREAGAAGARVIGGCCGTSPAHLAAMRAALAPAAAPS